MWSTAQNDLEELLSQKIYPALLEDPVYQHFLAFAGLSPARADDYSVPAPQRKNVRTAAKIRAYLIASEVEKTGALKEDTVDAKLLLGPLDLYRFWDASTPEKRVGVWWFDREVIDLCKRNTPRLPQARKQWFREHLAVSLDWSKLDRIDRISLSPNLAVPAIVGVGNPMRVYTPDAVSTKMSSRANKPLPMAKATLKEYWENLGKYFPGGVQQTVLPFVPHADVMDLDGFLRNA